MLDAGVLNRKGFRLIPEVIASTHRFITLGLTTWGRSTWALVVRRVGQISERLGT